MLNAKRILGTGLFVLAAVGLGSATANAAPVAPETPGVQVSSISAPATFTATGDDEGCLNKIGDRMGAGAIMGGLATIEAGGIGILPGVFGGAIVGGIECVN